MIQLQHINKHYNDTPVLNGINLDIKSGKSIAITGNSGSGKSTILSLIAGIDTVSSGSIIFDNNDITHYNELELVNYRKNNVGFVFQFHHLLPDFNLLENIALPLLINKESKKTAYSKAMQLLKSINLEHRASHFISELSGGERQRGAILRAIITKPKLIIADEPTGNLDEANSQVVVELLLDLAKIYGSAIIMATHNKHIANKLDEHYAIVKGALCKQR